MSLPGDATMLQPPRRTWRRLLVENLAVMVAYAVTGRIGLGFALVHGSVTLVWPPSGIAVAALTLGGAWLLPGVVLGAVITNYSAPGMLPFTLATAVGNPAEAWVSSLLLRRVLRFRPAMDRVRDVLGLSLLAAPAGSVLGATVGMMALWSLGRVAGAALPRAWLHWLLGDALGIVVVAPLIFTLTAALTRPALGRRDWLALCALLPAIALASLALFGKSFPVHPEWSILVVPLLVVVALRFSPREVALANLLVGISAAVGSRDLYAMDPEMLERSLVTLAMLLATSNLTAQALAAVHAQRSRVERELARSRREWRDIFEAIDQPILVLDRAHNTIEANRATTRLTGLSADRLRGRKCYEVFHGTSRPPDGCPMETMRERSFASEVETLMGTFQVTCTPLLDEAGRPHKVLHVATDVTERKAYERRLRKGNRALRILSQCSSVTVQASDETTLLEEVCRICVGQAGYRMAWVGYPENDPQRSVRVAAVAGPGAGFLERAHFCWGDDEDGSGVVGTAIRTGQPVLERDLLGNPRFAPWREALESQGFAAVIAVPLRTPDTTYGALAVYAAEGDTFDDAEVGLIEELGRNLAHGIMAMRARLERGQALDALERARTELEDRVAERTAQLTLEMRERLQAEEELRRNERKYRELVENANSIILRMDTQGRVTFFNEFAQRFFGFSEQEILGRSVVGTIVPTTDASGRDLAELMDRIARHPHEFARGLNENMCKDGRRVWIAWTNRPVFDAAGTLVETLCVGVDVTELKRTAEHLRVFRSFADNAGQGFGMADLDLRLVYVNPALLRMLGVERRDPREGERFTDHYPPEERARLEGEILPALLQSGQWTGELATVGPAGRWIPTLQNIFLIRDQAGHPRFIAGLVTDITRQKEAERELRRAKETAEAADRTKSAFLATMSHELRTPLNSIIGFTGILLQGLAGPLNPEQTTQLGMVKTSARHLLALINDVLDISKIEAGQMQVCREPFDPARSIGKVAQVLTPLAERKGLELRLELPSVLPAMAGDERRFEQVLMNLLGNAIKFTEQGVVRLHCEVDGAQLHTRVCDTGIGIRQDQLASIFLPFHQVDEGITRRHEGTGLGLSICKRLVELMGGSMAVTSQLGVGSTFSCTLPLGSGDPP